MDASPGSTSRPVDRPRARHAVVLLLSAVALALIAVAWHLTALSAYTATSDGGGAGARLSSARLAAALEPWNARYRWRVVTLTALVLLQEGKIDAAFFLLEPYSQIVRDDPLYRSVYQRVVSIKTPLDSRKAHMQHAREQTGGILLEKDVIH
jgi:hypothetical protein